MNPIPCFMVTACEEQEAWLRVYVSGQRFGHCDVAEGGYHNALVHIGRIPLRYAEDGRSIESTPLVDYSLDPRWPEVCACGHEFHQDTATWQILGRQLWEADGGERRILDPVGADTGRVPVWGPGAMFDAFWLPEPGSFCTTRLSVVLPNALGERGTIWHIGLPSSRSKAHWTVTGTPPRVSVTPSIWDNAGEGPPHEFHGFLTDGKLVSV